MPLTYQRLSGIFWFTALLGGAISGLTYAKDKADSGKVSDQAPALTLSDKELRDVQQKLKAFQHLKVSFTQETYRSLRKKTSITIGMAYFSKPDRFRWILEKPQADEWIFDGKTLSHYLPERREAVSYSGGVQKGKEFRQIVDMVLNFDNLLTKFSINSATKEENTANIVLLPKQQNGDIDRAQLGIDLKENYIKSLQLFFGHGNHTTLQFSSPDRKPVSPETFQVPAGTKVSKAG